MVRARAGKAAVARAVQAGQGGNAGGRSRPSMSASQSRSSTTTRDEKMHGERTLKENILKKNHYLFKWIVVDAGRENEWISADEIVDQHGVREHIVHHYIEGEIRGEKNVLTLPWALLTIVLYALMMLGKEEVNLHNSMANAVEFDIKENANFGFTAPGNMGHKNYEDVNCYADFWSWMNKGFMPLLYKDQVPTSEDSGLDLGPLTPLQKNRYLGSNAKVGPVKLAKESTVETECINSDMSRVFGIFCDDSTELDMQLKPVENVVSQSTFYEDTPSTVWLNGFEIDNQQKLKDLETSLWVDKATNRVQISFLTYEPDQDILRLSNVNFLFSRTGQIWKQFTQRSIVVNPYYNFWAYLFDILFYLNVTFVFGHELFELIVHLRKNRESPLRSLRDYFGVWNAVDWLFIFLSYSVLALWLVRLEKMRAVTSAVLDLPQDAADCSSDCSAYYSDIYRQMDELGFFIRTSQVVFAIGPVVVLLRVFKAFSAQPRLAMLTDTILQASSQLAHYLVVFMSMISTYAVMGVALFGREIPQFATLDRAFPTLFMAGLGAFDFDAAQTIGRFYAFIFYAAFMMLIVLVMLSMLIAIIMDKYIEVKAHALKSETLWTEMCDIVRRTWQDFRKVRLPLGFIQSKLTKDSSDVLKVDTFMQQVPGLSVRQARRLLVESVSEFGQEHGQEPETLDVKQFTDDVVMELTTAVGATTIHENIKATVIDKDDVAAKLFQDQAEPEDRVQDITKDVATSLDVLPLDQLLDLAAKKLEKGCATPDYAGSTELIQHALQTARSLCTQVCTQVVFSCKC
mmetsp:Transcript_35493/g.93707  ORF Transcript_35493/g.93707 Transcript_35493/m.93707 type:complete len:799 (+) Transcript_35493:120-2516(+)